MEGNQYPLAIMYIILDQQGKIKLLKIIILFLKKLNYKNKGKNTIATMDINFIKILSEGPAVSLKGSPTVSPVTAAL